MKSYKRKKIRCPEGKVAVVHTTNERYVKSIYRDGVLPKCKISSDVDGKVGTYLKEPKTKRHCAAFAHLEKHATRDGFPICACIDPKKAYVGDYSKALQIFTAMHIIESYVEEIGNIESGKTTENVVYLEEFKAEIETQKKNAKRYAKEYNKSTFRLDKYLASKKLQVLLHKPEILIPEGIKPSEIRKCVI